MSFGLFDLQVACCSGGVVGLFVSKAMSGKYSLIRSINCSIAGMVSLCSGCNVFAPWASSIVAAVGALTYQLLSGLMVAIRIDDPVDAIAVHGAGGIIGILSVPLFMEVMLMRSFRKTNFLIAQISYLGLCFCFIFCQSSIKPMNNDPWYSK